MSISLAFKMAELTGDPWSKLIAAASKSPYSHVEMWVAGPQNLAMCWSSREPKGVSSQIIDLTQPYWLVLQVPLDLKAEDLVNGFCIGADGKEYDALGLLGYKFGNGLHDDHDVFCSEFCSSALQKCAGLYLGRDPWMISPGDLHDAVTGAATWVKK